MTDPEGLRHEPEDLTETPPADDHEIVLALPTPGIRVLGDSNSCGNGPKPAVSRSTDVFKAPSLMMFEEDVVAGGSGDL